MSTPDHSWHPVRLLDDGRKLAGVAAVALLVSLFFPWYEKSFVPAGGKQFVSTSLSAFGAFTWVEAALVLVDVAVIALLWLRSTGRRVELPFGDGTMIALAGGWTVVLLLVRVFDRPSVTGNAGSAGLQWGLLVALAAAGTMLAAGLAVRAVDHATKRPGPSGGAPEEPFDAAGGSLRAATPERWRRRPSG